jgi:hypothetical protein
MFTALEQMERLELVQRGAFPGWWAVTTRGRLIHSDAYAFVERASQPALSQDEKELLEVVNRLSPHEGHDFAWVKSINHSQILAELAWRDGMPRLQRAARRLDEQKLVAAKAWASPVLELRATCAGLSVQSCKDTLMETRVMASLNNEMASTWEWDVFLSHAGEDKEAVARPLRELLERQGLRVWLDEVNLKLGDSLFTEIQNALSRSRFGVVIVSPASIRKQWPQRELAALFEREIQGAKVILPVWHQLSAADVTRAAPLIADKLAARTDQGLPEVVRQIIDALHQAPRTSPPTSAGSFTAALPRIADVGTSAGDHSSRFRSLLGLSLDSADQRTRAVMRAYVAPLQPLDRKRFSDTDRHALDALRRDSFHWLTLHQHTAAEIRFAARQMREVPETDQLIVQANGTSHYVQLLPTSHLPDGSRSVPWSTIHTILFALVRLTIDAYTQIFDYEGRLFVGVALERMDNVHVSFDLVDVQETVAKPRRGAHAAPPQTVVVEDEQGIAAGDQVVARVAELATALLDDLVYDGGHEYIASWVAAGGRSPG